MRFDRSRFKVINFYATRKVRSLTSICIARLRERLQLAQIWITQCYLQTTPYLLLPVSIPQVTPPRINTANAWVQLTTHLSTQRGWMAELAMLADIERTVYPDEVTRKLHVMAQARESSPVIDGRSNHCDTLPIANYMTSYWWWMWPKLYLSPFPRYSTANSNITPPCFKPPLVKGSPFTFVVNYHPKRWDTSGY